MKRCKLVVLSIALVVSPAHAEAPPRPHAGTIPLELDQVAGASGPDLRLEDFDLTISGKRIRFVGEVEEATATASGEGILTLSDGGDRVTMRLPGPLDAPEKLDRDEEWEVITRLGRPVTLADGRTAFTAGADTLVKTPGPPGQELTTDVIVRVAGADFFNDPKLPGWEAKEPLYSLEVTKPGTVQGDFTIPGQTAFAAATGSRGGQMYDYRQSTRSADGRELAVRCVYRVENGRLRNTSYGSVELASDGSRSNEKWVDLESETFHDTWSAVRKPFPPNTYYGACLGQAMTGFPFGSNGVVRFYLWGDRGMPAPMYAFVDGEETIDVRGKPEKARRIKVGLDVRRAAQQIDVPEPFKGNAEAVGETWHSGDATYWVAADAPHVLLRYDGPIGPPGAPEVRLERIR